MKRKILSILLAALMVVSLFSMTALAEEPTGYNVWVDGVEVTSANCTDILDGTANDGKVSFNPATNTLTLADGTNIESTFSAISAQNIDLTIVVQGSCELVSTSGDAIYVQNDNLTISGGSLDINSYINGICVSEGDIVIENCDSLKIMTAGGHCITTTGVFNDNGTPDNYDDDTYTPGGNVTLSGCEGVTLNNYDGADGSGIYAEGGVKLMDCPIVDIDSSWNAIYAWYGDVVIDNCDDFDINAKIGGIVHSSVCVDPDSVDYSGSVNIKNCDSVNIAAAEHYCIVTDGLYDNNGTPDNSDDDFFISGADVTISDCKKVTLNNINSESTGICACGDVNIINCPTVDIDAGWCGISVSGGDIVIDNCDDFDINAKGSGIYLNYMYADPDSVDYTCSVTIKNCDSVNITAHFNSIYADGIYAQDNTYITGGDVTIENCGKVALNNIDSAYTSLSIEGDVNITDCPDVDIDAGWNGIYAWYGDISIENSKVDVLAMQCGIEAYYGDVAVTDSTVKTVCNADRFKEIWEYDLVWETNWSCGFETYGTLKIQNSTVEVESGNLGCDFWYDSADPNNVYDYDYNGYYWAEYYGTRSYGIYAYDVVITGSKVTAKGGTADYANGFNGGSITVSGKSTVDFYGGSCAGSVYDYPEAYAIYTWDDVELDGKNVVVNLYGGDNGLETDDPDYWKQAYYGGWWYDEDNGNELVSTDLTVKNGAKLTADSAVWAQGDVTIDGSRVEIHAPVGYALSVGGYENDGLDDSDYFGTLTMSNDATLIATTDDEFGCYSAVYAYGAMDIRDSEFFASSASGDAIGCPFDNFDFNELAVSGDTNPVAFEGRDTVNTPVTFKFSSALEEYTAVIDDSDVALTVYAGTIKEEPEDIGTEGGEGENAVVPNANGTSPKTGETDSALWLTVCSGGLFLVLLSLTKRKEENSK